MRRVPEGLLGALPVHALDVLGIAVIVRDAGPRQVVRGDVTDAAHVPRHLRDAHHTRPPLYLLSAVAIGPSEPGGWPLSSSIVAARLR